jgi:TP901 family phage tail tape measure protein
MANRYSIEAVFSLIDKVTPKLDGIGINSNKVGDILKKDFMRAEKSVDDFGNRLKTIGKYAIGAGIAAVSAGVVVATKQFIEFDAALYKAGAVFSDLDSTAPGFNERLAEIGKTARTVAAATEFNAQQAAAALQTMAMAGINSEQAISLLPATADLATAAGIDLATAAGIAADSLGVFRMMSDDPAELAKNFSYISDIFAKGSSLANMDIGLMFEAASEGGAQFTKTNQSIEDFGALVDGLASVNIKGSEAGRALNVMMTRLAAPAKAGADAMEALGIKTTDSEGNLLNFIDIIEQFQGKLAGKGTAEAAGYINAIFGKQYITQASALIDIGADRLREYSTELAGAGGATIQMAETMRNSIGNRIEVMKSALMELGFKFVEAFQTQGVGVIEKLTAAISTFDPTPIINGVKMAADVIMWLASAFWTLRVPIMIVVGAMYLYKAGMIAAAIASRGYAMVMGVVKTAQFLFTLAIQGQTAVLALLKGGSIAAAVATKIFALGAGIATGATAAWSAAVGFLNTLFIATPIGWIILAIGALIAIIIVVVKNWDAISAAVARAWEWIKNIAALIWENLVNAFHSLVEVIQNNTEKVFAFIAIFTGPFGFIISIVKELFDNWSAIVEVFKTDGIIAGFKRLGGVILSAVLAPIQGLLEMLAHIPGVGELLGPAVEKIQNFRNELKGLKTADATIVENVVPGTVMANAGGSAVMDGRRRNQAITNAAIPPTRPMTTAEQITNIQRNEDSMEISVAPEPGARARITRQPNRANIRALNSGSNR